MARLPFLRLWLAMVGFTLGCAHRAPRDSASAPKSSDSEVVVCWEGERHRIARHRPGLLPLYLLDSRQPPSGQLGAPLPPQDDGGALAGACLLLVWRLPSVPPGELGGHASVYQRVRTADGQKISRMSTVFPTLTPPPDPETQRLFQSVDDPRGRELEIWAVGSDGQRGQRLLKAGPVGEFPDFPMFGLDDQRLLVALNPGP